MPPGLAVCFFRISSSTQLELLRKMHETQLPNSRKPKEAATDLFAENGSRDLVVAEAHYFVRACFFVLDANGPFILACTWNPFVFLLVFWVVS